MEKENATRLILTDLTQIARLLEERIWFHYEAALEFRALPDLVQLEAMQHLAKIVLKPRLGQTLENKHGLDLAGYRKVYFDKYTRRIVYELYEEGKIKIWGIGDRAELQVYKDAHRRRSSKQPV